MYRKFTNVIAGTGTVFALLHVFIGYMGFDKTPSETTGETPSFLDLPEYWFYLALAAFFALTVVVSAIFRKRPAIVLVPATVTVTYVLLLLDADQLTKGKMTFTLFALFVFAGYLLIAASVRGKRGRELLLNVLCFMGAFMAGWAITVYFRAPGMIEQMVGAVKPIETLDGIPAMWAFERRKALAELAEAENHIHYLVIPAIQIVSAFFATMLPRVKLLTRLSSLVLFGYICVSFSFAQFSYAPMFFLVPMLAYVIGCQVLCALPAPEADAEIDGSTDAVLENGADA